MSADRPPSGPSDLGPARSRWNDRYRQRGAGPGAPPPALVRLYQHLAGTGDGGDHHGGGLAVELAGGDGSGVLWLAEHGCTPVLVEVSDVAIGLAEQEAPARGVNLFTVQRDLETETLGSVLERVADVVQNRVATVSCVHYLNRTLLASVAAGLPPGAAFMASIATVANQERHERPSARFLLDRGELVDLVMNGDKPDRAIPLTVIHSSEGWTAEGTHEAELVVMRQRT